MAYKDVQECGDEQGHRKFAKFYTCKAKKQETRKGKK